MSLEYRNLQFEFQLEAILFFGKCAKGGEKPMKNTAM